MQSAADHAGRQAEITGHLFGLFLGVTGLFFVVVLVFLGWAILRRDRGGANEQRLRVSVATWAAAITAGLFILTIGSYFTDRHIARAAAGLERPLQIRMTAQQWWWDVEYVDPAPSHRIRTANELHLPVGVPVEIELASDDVIHSFWVPNLAGKEDLIPGRTNRLEILPTRVGRYRGQCAEFCGLQHSLMAFAVIVEPRADYEAWRAKSLQPAPPPQTALQKAGYQYFMERQCSACHAIGGTPASASVGPDLTRVASRLTLAAGTLPNKHAPMTAWLRDPQKIKPGNRMPTIPMTDDDLRAVTAYLETLT